MSENNESFIQRSILLKPAFIEIIKDQSVCKQWNYIDSLTVL